MLFVPKLQISVSSLSSLSSLSSPTRFCTTGGGLKWGLILLHWITSRNYLHKAPSSNHSLLTPFTLWFSRVGYFPTFVSHYTLTTKEQISKVLKMLKRKYSSFEEKNPHVEARKEDDDLLENINVEEAGNLLIYFYPILPQNTLCQTVNYDKVVKILFFSKFNQCSLPFLKQSPAMKSLNRMTKVKNPFLSLNSTETWKILLWMKRYLRVQSPTKSNEWNSLVFLSFSAFSSLCLRWYLQEWWNSSPRIRRWWWYWNKTSKYKLTNRQRSLLWFWRFWKWGTGHFHYICDFVSHFYIFWCCQQNDSYSSIRCINAFPLICAFDFL